MLGHFEIKGSHQNASENQQHPEKNKFDKYTNPGLSVISCNSTTLLSYDMIHI